MKTIPKNFIEGSLESRRYAFLLDEVNHFNSNNRSQNIGTLTCFYSPPHKNTEGCAIGRWLQSELQLKLNKIGGASRQETFDNLPEWMRELGQDFLVECQNLHDIPSFWCETGLSVDGEREFNEIVDKYAKRTVQTT